MENPNTGFMKRLNGLCKERNISQGDVSRGIGLTRQSISLYAAGKRSPDIITLNKLCDFFSVSADYLLGRTDFGKPENIKLVETLGLTDAAIAQLTHIKSINFQNMETLCDERTPIEVLNQMLASTELFTILTGIKAISNGQQSNADNVYENFGWRIAKKDVIQMALNDVMSRMIAKIES